MGRLLTRRSAGTWLVAAAIAAVAVAATPALGAHRATSGDDNVFAVQRLVSDVPGLAATVDPNLVNGWGLAALPTSPWWVADNGTSKSTLYTAGGAIVPLVVGVAGDPSGAVANPGSNFVVSMSGNSGPAKFIFDGEGGQILGWNPTVSGDAVVAVDLHDNAVYKGLAIDNADDMIYATDFHNGHVDVFDGSFTQVKMPGAFVDPTIPAGYAPFGIQNVGGMILVTYAKQDADRHDDVAGAGFGFVDAYDQNGTLLGRIASHGALNSPWGLAMAPSTFGSAAGDLLIGNFGDGRINVYRQDSPGHWIHQGKLLNRNGDPIVIEGLWSLQFGLGSTNNGSTKQLFFTAGPHGERHGLFGRITTA
jgi:uncharacterized protein (TIGR03118 family)